MKYMIIDGNSLTYRAFFALPTDLATASGQVTNAVYGFTSMLINLVRDHEPDVVAVAFDRPEPTFRHEVVKHYKANREAAPDILRQQMGLVREVVETLGLPSLELAGYEADDILATLATLARDRGDDVLLVTGDRDSYQLVEDPHIRVLYNRRGVSDYALYDEAGIKEKTGVTPGDYVAYAALRGDKSDNLPGVPGVGEKTAAKLINKYGGIDGIYENLDDQTPKLRENLGASETRVRENVDVMVLLRDLDLGRGLDDLRRGAVDPDALQKLFDFLEFHSLCARLAEAFGETDLEDATTNEVLEAEVHTVEDASGAAELVGMLSGAQGPLSLGAGWSGDAGDSELSGLAVVTDPVSAQVAWLPSELLSDDEVGQALAGLLATRPVTAHDVKPLMKQLMELDIDIQELALDTMLAAYLLDPAEARYSLGDVLRRYAGYELPDDEQPEHGQLALDTESVPDGLRAGREALAVALLVEPLSDALEAHSLTDLNRSVEAPLVRVLARMELLGVGVDSDELSALNDRLKTETEHLRTQIWQDAGEEFNVNSTQQLRRVLFEELGLTPQKKTKTGYSTDAATLDKLEGEHPIVGHLLRYRELEKLRSTYGEGLLSEVGSDGRIHATFNQTVARTGRLSSDRPNLHNIPVRTEQGRQFRRAFVPAEGYELLVADYNQIELRCIAHLADDPGLLNAFRTDRDIHTETAARVFGVDPQDITTELRSKAKMVSYGLAYGMEAYGLAQRLGIPTGEAQEILDAYFEAFPSVKSYMEATVAEARERGYTETLFGRRRQIPELASSNHRVRQAGERQAMNAGIQGLAADIFKVALVRLDAGLEDQQLASRLILQVHDEVMLEVPPDEHDRAADLTVTTMREAFDLNVPLDVNLAFGATWADAKA